MNSIEGFIRKLYWIILGGYLFLNLVSFSIAGEEQLINIFEDDAYYYFTIARNFIETGIATFDGHSLANGVQPLWLCLLLPFFAIIRNPIHVLRFIGIFMTLLAGAAGFLGMQFLKRYTLLPYTIGAVFILYCVISFGITGMETAALLLVMTITILLILHLKPWHPTKPTWKVTIATSVALSLLLISRLDTIFFLVITLSGLFFCYYKDRLNYFLFIAAGPGITLIGYLLINRFFFGQSIPSSAIAKSLGDTLPGFNDQFFYQLTHAGYLGQGNLWIVFGISLLFSFAYLLFWGIQKIRQKDPPSEMFQSEMWISTCIVFNFVLFSCYALFKSTWILFRWYGYPLFVMGIFVFPAIVERIFTRLSRISSFQQEIRHLAILFSLILTVPLCITGYRFGLWSKTVLPSSRFDNYKLVQILNDDFNDDTIVAMGDRAGSFAYFFRGNVLQLEGLVGEGELIEAIRSNTLMDYMNTFGVDYVFSYVGPSDEDYQQWVLLTPLPEYTTGPQAEIVLCQETEILRFKFPYETLFAWKWPSCIDKDMIGK